MTEDVTKLESLTAAFAHLETKRKAAQDAIALFNQNVKDLTGHDPTKPVGPLEVVNIVRKVFGL